MQRGAQPHLFQSVAILSIGMIIGAILMMSSHSTKAEQVNGSPESNATSRLQSLNNDLTTLGFGSATDSPDWGSSWNRIKTAAKYTPSGTATVSDVVSGKTFSDSTRTTKTGTYPAPKECPTQQYNDDYGAPVTENLNCSLTWTTATNPVTGDDNLSGRGGKDPRVPNLIFSQVLYRNGTVIQFSPTQTTIFSWDSSHANNQGITAPVAGSRTAIQLCADQGNGWRLPTEKELLQAYIDGSNFNLTQPSNGFWSSSENTSTIAWFVALYSGSGRSFVKSTATGVRCVRSGT